MTDPVIKRLSSHCDNKCKEKKLKAENEINEIIKLVNEEEKDWDETNKHLETGKKALEEINKLAISLATYQGGKDTKTKTEIIEMMKVAKQRKYLNSEQCEQMKKQIETNDHKKLSESIKKFKGITEKKLMGRMKNDKKNKKRWIKLRVEVESVRTGIKSVPSKEVRTGLPTTVANTEMKELA